MYTFCIAFKRLPPRTYDYSWIENGISMFQISLLFTFYFIWQKKIEYNWRNLRELAKLHTQIIHKADIKHITYSRILQFMVKYAKCCTIWHDFKQFRQMFKCTIFVLLDMYFSIQFSQYVSYERLCMTEKKLYWISFWLRCRIWNEWRQIADRTKERKKCLLNELTDWWSGDCCWKFISVVVN